MRRMHVLAAAAIAIVILVLAGWLVLAPGWAIRLAQDQVAQQLGRTLEVKGGAGLEFTPRLAIRLDNVSLSNPAGQDGSFIVARSVHIPVGVLGLITRHADLSVLDIDDPEFAFLVNERSEASWAFAAVKTPSPLTLNVANGAMRFYDARTQQAFSFSGARLLVSIGAEGDVAVTGTADIGGRLAKIDAKARSLARIHEDGSPLDLTVEAPEGSASFTGRLSTAQSLNLAGSVAIASPDLRAAAHWAGVAVEPRPGDNSLSITGALESAGRAFAIKQAQVKFGKMVATGDVVLDLRGQVPKLQAALASPEIGLDPFLPDSGRSAGQWGTKPLGFAALKSFDAELTVETQMLRHGNTAAGPSRIVVTLADGALKSSLVFPSIGQGKSELEAGIDAKAIPPSFSLNVKAEEADMQSLLPGVFAMPWLSGKGGFDVSLTGSGHTQQEIIGTLNGNMTVTLADGAIAGPDLSTALATVSQRVLEGWADANPGQTPFSVLSGTASVRDGIITIETGRLESVTHSIAVKGDIDLLRHAVDLRAEPRIITADGLSAAFPVPVIIKGPWDKPRIYPDLPDILANPKAAYEQLKAMGLPASN
ncbi:MAG: AsmA family protein [Alphaproteobacteria bacterium]|nr:AsmA family protein [Alphaproteobacteria bacterium]